jgi:FSR family fosmidomycin resistance protein-like MFS transporter
MIILDDRAHLTMGQQAQILGVGSVASGLIQPIVAALSDRFNTRWLGTLGLAVAAVTISLVGYAHSFAQLVIIQAVGSAGVGAFHPIAAAAAGQLGGPRRSRTVAIFYAAGMLGMVVAGWVVPLLVNSFGITRLAYLIIPGLLMAGALAWAIHDVQHRSAAAHADHASLPERERRGRWIDVGLLFSANTVRFFVNTMLVQLMLRWTQQWVIASEGVPSLTEALRAKATSINGPLQGAMAIGQGTAGVLVGLFVVQRFEKKLLVFVPIAGALAVATIPHVNAVWMCWSLMIAAGAGFAGVMPITISMAQRLLPHRTSLASALMMGAAWTLAALGPTVAQWLYESVGLNAAFGWAAGLLALSAVLALPLRGVAR